MRLDAQFLIDARALGLEMSACVGDTVKKTTPKSGLSLLTPAPRTYKRVEMVGESLLTLKLVASHSRFALSDLI